MDLTTLKKTLYSSCATQKPSDLSIDKMLRYRKVNMGLLSDLAPYKNQHYAQLAITYIRLIEKNLQNNTFHDINEHYSFVIQLMKEITGNNDLYGIPSK